jgi:hypothetical protein
MIAHLINAFVTNPGFAVQLIEQTIGSAALMVPWWIYGGRDMYRAAADGATI